MDRRGHVPAPSVEEIFRVHPEGEYPKGLAQNLEYRWQLLEDCAKDADYQAFIAEKCRDDLLFWVNSFVWLIEPRTTEVIPFITYPYQDRIFGDLQAAMGHHDLIMVKSRDMGGTWMVVTAFTHQWQFCENASFQLVSRVQDDVDTVGDYSTILPKIDFILDHQPDWLAPSVKQRSRKQLILQNRLNESLFRGYPTTANVGLGGRRRGTLFDEFAAVPVDQADATLATTQFIGTRIWCSTPRGPSNTFAKLAHDPRVRRVDLDWSEHPEKNPGLYTCVKGRLKELDPNPDFVVYDSRVSSYEARDGTINDWPVGQKGFPSDYRFILDGKRRSPYYDYECQRTPIPQHIAQELDRDFLKSGAQFFDGVVLAKIRRQCRPPEFVGNFIYDPQTGDLPLDIKGKLVDPRAEVVNGSLMMWANLLEPSTEYTNAKVPTRNLQCVDITCGDIPPFGEYVLGVDVAVGSGASCSTIAVVDCLTGEHVAEYANPHIAPHELAPLVKAMAVWLNEAFIIWDGNGSTGRMFSESFLKLGYPKFYRRHTTDLARKETLYPGWFGGRDEKAAAFSAVKQAFADKQLVTYSEWLLNEAGEYVWADRSIEHSSVPGNKDPTGARSAHGDRVMALVMAWHAAPDVLATVVEKPVEVPVNSMASRIRAADDLARKNKRFARVRQALRV